MKTRLLLLLLSIFCISMQAQTVRYDFDSAGNFISVHLDNLLVETNTPLEKITAVLGKPSQEYLDSGIYSVPVQRNGMVVTKWKYKHLVFSAKGIELIQDIESGLWQEIAVFLNTKKGKSETGKFGGTLLVNNESLNEKENRAHFIKAKTNTNGWYSAGQFVYRKGTNSLLTVEFSNDNTIECVKAEWNTVKIKKS